MAKIHYKIVYWLPAALWMLLIFIMSSRPTVHASAIDWQDFFIKKTAHFIEYFILNLLFLYSLKKTTFQKNPQLIFTALILTILYAISDEFHQTFVSGREGRPRDVFIDSFGASVSALLFSQTRLSRLYT
jgi:VanZ family protein